MTLTTELHSEPLSIAGDLSHLQQAVENLLFNARDATFEMRNHLREEARKRVAGGQPPVASEEAIRGQWSGISDGKQAVISAAGWKGAVIMRTRQAGDFAVLEVWDNGIGMNEEVRRRCTETHFSTKRDNAIYEGNTTGMGLGLSFVVVILGHHKARLEIESQPLQGALFRASFPLLTNPSPM